MNQIIIHLEDPPGSGLAACNGEPISDFSGLYPNVIRVFCQGCRIRGLNYKESDG